MRAALLSLRPPGLRLASWGLSALVVALLLALALMARVGVQSDRSAPYASIESWIVETPRPMTNVPQGAAAHARTLAALLSAPPHDAPETAPALHLAALRCATAAGRREAPDLCAGVAASIARAPQLAIPRVDGVYTSEGALQRSILRSVNVRAGSYALGEAQKYIDPRQDPLYEEGTDPATAAMRPCPAGTLPHGDGHGLTGRTCQPMR